MPDTTARFKTRNIRDLIRQSDRGPDGKPAPVYHDPYRWSHGPRKADRNLDVPGPNVSVHSS